MTRPKSADSPGEDRPDSGGGPEPSEAVFLSALRDAAAVLFAYPARARDLDPLVEAAARGASGAGGALFVLDPARDDLAVEGVAGLDAVRDRSVLIAMMRQAAVRSISTRELFSVDLAVPEDPGPAGSAGDLSLYGSPVTAGSEVAGAMVLFASADPSSGSAHPGRLDRLSLFADLAALALQKKRLTADRARLEKDRRDLEREHVRREPLAELGELTARLAEEVKAPISTVCGFARRVVSALAPGDPNREYLEVIAGEMERLDRLFTEHRELVAAGRCELRLEDLNEVAEEALRRQRELLLTRRVRLIRRLAPGLPRLLLDSEKVRTAVTHIVDNLLADLPTGGRIKIESKRKGETVLLLLAADSERGPGRVLDTLFVPFRGSAPPSGVPAPALSLARRVIRDHGGEIGVRSDAEWAVLFTLSFPIKQNEDKRRANDRRRGDERRRPGGHRNAA